MKKYILGILLLAGSVFGNKEDYSFLLKGMPSKYEVCEKVDLAGIYGQKVLGWSPQEGEPIQVGETYQEDLVIALADAKKMGAYQVIMRLMRNREIREVACQYEILQDKDLVDGVLLTSSWVLPQ